MSLEVAVQENTATLRELVALLRQGAVHFGHQVITAITESPSAQVAVERLREELPVEPKVEPKVEPIPYETVKKAVLALTKTDKRPQVITVLTQFGVTSAPMLKPEQYSEFLVALKAATK